MKIMRRQFLRFVGAATALFASPYVLQPEAQGRLSD
jgi:hypothetical protein